MIKKDKAESKAIISRKKKLIFIVPVEERLGALAIRPDIIVEV